MNLSEAIKLFKLLPVDPDRAITISEIVSTLINNKVGSKIESNERTNVTRKIQHYIFDLKTLETGALVECLENSYPPRYYLNLKNVAHWFMTEQAALNIIFTKQLISNYFAEIPQLNLDDLSITAESVIQESSRLLKNVSNRIRMVPDGIRRLKAEINPEVLQVVYKAIGSNMQLEMEYESSKQQNIKDTFNPYGLVAKDSTLYLIADRGLGGELRSYPLHRVKAARFKSVPALVPQSFDIDAYLKKTNNLSHVLYGETEPIKLILKVETQTIYHFQEKPLSEDQTIEKLAGEDYFIVQALIPNTLLLVPFLLSMGGWVEVLAPKSVRDEIAARLQKSLDHYL